MYAVLVKPNTEQSVSLALIGLGIECLLPTLIFHKRISRHANKTIEVEKLAIPCVFFVDDKILNFGFDRMRELVPHYRGVMRGAKAVLEFPREQIESFKANCDAHKAGIDETMVGADGQVIRKGDFVRICFGPFTGVEGFVDRIIGGVAVFVCKSSSFVSNAKIRLSFLEKIRDKSKQDDR